MTEPKHRFHWYSLFARGLNESFALGKIFSSGTQHRPVTAPCFFYVHERAVLIIPAKVTPRSPIPRVQYTFTQFTFKLFNNEIVLSISISTPPFRYLIYLNLSFIFLITSNFAL